MYNLNSILVFMSVYSILYSHGKTECTKISHKINFFWVLYSSSYSNSSHLTVLLSHCVSTWSPPELRHLSYRGTNFSLPCSYQSVSSYQPQCDNSFRLFLVSAKTQLQERKKKLTTRRRNHLIASQ